MFIRVGGSTSNERGLFTNPRDPPAQTSARLRLSSTPRVCCAATWWKVFLPLCSADSTFTALVFVDQEKVPERRSPSADKKTRGKNVGSGRKRPSKVSEAKAAKDTPAVGGRGGGGVSSKQSSGSSKAAGGCGEDEDEGAQLKKRKHGTKEGVWKAGTGARTGGKGGSKPCGAKSWKKGGTRDSERESAWEGEPDAAATADGDGDGGASVGRIGGKACRAEHENGGRGGGAKRKKDEALMTAGEKRGDSAPERKSKGNGSKKNAASAPRDTEKHPRAKNKRDETGGKSAGRKLVKGSGGSKKEKKAKVARNGARGSRKHQDAGQDTRYAQASSGDQFADDATRESNSLGHRQHSHSDTVVSSGFSAGWVEPSGREAERTNVRSTSESSPQRKQRAGASGAEAEAAVAAASTAPPAVADLRLAVVAEGSGRQEDSVEGKGAGDGDEVVAAAGWVSPPRASEPSPNDDDNGKAAMPARLMMSEEEEGGGDDREDESTVIKGVVKRGAGTAVCGEVDGGGGRGAIGAGAGGATVANVVPVLSGPSVRTADPHTLAAAHVLISGLGV